MKEQFIPYEQALELKELGFDEKCLGSYKLDNNEFQLNEIYSALPIVQSPLWQQAFDWFVEKYGLLGDPFPVLKDRYFFTIRKVEFNDYQQIVGSPFNPTDAKLNIYDSRVACLKKLIKIVKK